MLDSLIDRSPWTVLWYENGLAVGAVFAVPGKGIKAGAVEPIPDRFMDEYVAAGKDAAVIHQRLLAARHRMRVAREAMRSFVAGFDQDLVGELDSWLDPPHLPRGRILPAPWQAVGSVDKL